MPDVHERHEPMMQTLAAVLPITRKPRPESYYEAPAAIFLSTGIPSAALRRRGLEVPEDADVLCGTAASMDELAAAP